MSRLVLVCLGATAALVLLFAVEQSFTLGPAAGRVLIYVHALLVLALLLLVGTMVGHLFCPSDSKCVVIAPMLMLFVPDPYSAGRTGGHFGFQIEYPWQIVATMALAALLVLAAIALRSASRETALRLLRLEFIIFVAVNLIYVVRDGLYVRGFGGDPSSPLPLFLILAGSGLRLYTQAGFERRRSKPLQGR